MIIIHVPDQGNSPGDRFWMGWWGHAKRQEFLFLLLLLLLRLFLFLVLVLPPPYSSSSISSAPYSSSFFFERSKIMYVVHSWTACC